jgi:hypothetical protein
MSRPPLPDDIEALIAGVALQAPDENLAPSASSPDDYGTMLPELQERPTLFLHREQWVLALLGSRETLMTRVIGIRFAYYLDVRSGRCDPAYGSVARELGVPRPSVMRAVSRLEDGGWLEVERHGGAGGRTNNFSLKMPVRCESQNYDTQTENKVERISVANSAWPTRKKRGTSAPAVRLALQASHRLRNRSQDG